MASRRTQEAGFTLVEVLVALAIAAVAMVALFRAATQSTTASISVDKRMAAATLARSLLLDTAQAPMNVAVNQKGKSEDLSYAITATPMTGASGRLAPRGLALYDVTVTVTWAPRGRYDLSTVVLGN
jgi:type II secretion system protein I